MYSISTRNLTYANTVLTDIGVQLNWEYCLEAFLSDSIIRPEYDIYILSNKRVLCDI